jgi:plastocyanin
MNAEVREMRERAVYPILIPLAAIVVTELVVFSMSRVLLVAGKMPATIIALAVALGILVGAAFVAARPRIKTAPLLGFLVLLGIGTIAVGGYASTQQAFYEREAEANRPEIDVGAADLAFDTDTLELPPSGAVINFSNDDSQAHNVAIYPSAEELSAPLFKGEIINGGASTVYEIPAIDPGKYYFQCDVHPTMKGDAIVEEGAGTAAHEGAH